MSDTEFKNKVQKMEEDASKLRNKVLYGLGASGLSILVAFVWWTVSQVNEINLNLARDGRFTKVEAQQMEHRINAEIKAQIDKLAERIEKIHD